MSLTIPIYDPYRHQTTTQAQFARDEGTNPIAVNCYLKRHGSLVGFRERPPHGGPQARIFTHNGVPIKMNEACLILHTTLAILRRYRKEPHFESEITRIPPEALTRRTKPSNAIPRLMPDGTYSTLSEFAKKHGCSRSAVDCYYHKHGRSLEGFENRRPSRTRPLLVTCGELHATKTRREWADYFHVTSDSIKAYQRTHNGTLDGYTTRAPRTGRRSTVTVTYNGEQMPLSECVRRIGASYSAAYFYGKHHNWDLTEYNPSETCGRPSLTITHKGETHTIAEWARIYGVDPATIYHWTRKHNGTLDGFESRPPRGYPPRQITHNGLTKTCAQWATHYGVGVQAIYRWLAMHNGSLTGFEAPNAKREASLRRTRSNRQ